MTLEHSRLDRQEWRVGPVSHRDAIAFITEEHYALGAPNTAVVRTALYPMVNDRIRGIALWLPPTRNAALSVNQVNPGGVLALSRLCVASDVPANGASFLLGRSMRTIDRERWPILLTYADTAYGHTGAIYLATNWTRLGEVPGADAWALPTGERRGRKRGDRNLTAAEMREARRAIRPGRSGSCWANDRSARFRRFATDPGRLP